MTFADEVTRLVDDCARYWAKTGVPRRRVTEMRMELAQHLEEAMSDGRSPASVVGPDPTTFARRGRSSTDRNGGRLPPGRT